MYHWLLLLIKLMGLAFRVQALGFKMNANLCSTLKSNFLESVLLFREVFFLVHLHCEAVCQLPVHNLPHLKFICKSHSLSRRGNHLSVPMAWKCFKPLYPALLIIKKFKDSKGLSTWELELLKTVVPKTSSELDCKRKKRWMSGKISLHCKLQHWAVQWFQIRTHDCCTACLCRIWNLSHGIPRCPIPQGVDVRLKGGHHIIIISSSFQDPKKQPQRKNNKQTNVNTTTSNLEALRQEKHFSLPLSLSLDSISIQSLSFPLSILAQFSPSLSLSRFSPHISLSTLSLSSSLLSSPSDFPENNRLP